jgi:hypothetical protein
VVAVKAGMHVAPSRSPTLAEAADNWLKASAAASLERATIKGYSEQVRLHITPFLGTRKISRCYRAARSPVSRCPASKWTLRKYHKPSDENSWVNSFGCAGAWAGRAQCRA